MHAHDVQDEIGPLLVPPQAAPVQPVAGVPEGKAGSYAIVPNPYIRQELNPSVEDIPGMGLVLLTNVVSGLSITNGKLGPAVRKAMISGNLLDLMSHLDTVADDLTFYGGVGSPTLRVADMSVA